MSPPAALAAASLLTFVMLMVASLARSRGWTISGFRLAVGNRDDLPPATPFMGRAERAARNMVENLVLFVAVLLAASMAGAPADRLAMPCAVFVGARVIYAPLYWVGVPYLRTGVWAVSMTGLVQIALLAVAR